MSGKQALEIIKEDVKKQNYKRSSFTLILMDFEMPEINGNECTQMIRDFLYFEDLH